MNIEQAAHVEVCIAHMHTNLLPAAVKQYRDYLSRHPRNLIYRGFLIYALTKMKDWQGVVAECRAMLKVSKNRGVRACAHFRIAMALDKLGYRDEAAGEMAAAAKLLPNCKPFRDAAFRSFA